MINSLYLRLSLTAILVISVFLAATATVLDNAYLEGSKLALRERMLGIVYQLLTASQVDENGHLIMPLPTDLPSPQLALPDSGWYAFVSRNPEDSPIWRSPSLRTLPTPTPFPVKVGEKHWQELKLDDEKAYYLLGFGFQRTVKTGVFPFNFYLLTELAPIENDLHAFRQRLWSGLAGAAVLLFTVQVWLMRWGLKPLREVGGELSAIESGTAVEIAGHYPYEVKKLTDRINILLIQERARQTRYRNALADLAHSLKTPLAVLLSTGEPTEDLAHTVQEQATRMLRIVERQLQRAGASGSTTLPPIAVAQVTERVTASLSKVYRWKNITVTNEIDPGLLLRLDEADLIEILGNVLDNAFKWSHSRILLRSRKHNHLVILSIDDDGPGILAEDINRILLRGGRADESTPGHGIGLSVVTDVVEAYQGRLNIGVSKLGGALIEFEFAEV
ncbi:MAG: ATP-binding protein [Methylovulum sp.]|nr:ATP-binding protein [Methylovulum sp.]